MPPSDSDLLDAFARDGAERSFLALYDRHAGAMYALAYRLLGGNEADAADALQDAWTRVLPRLPQFRGESSLRTWLCGFVVNCCRERFRAPLFEQMPDDGQFEATSSVPSVLLRGLGTIDLERALASLPAGSRSIVILHDLEGYTHREIGAALGIDEGTSKSQLSRGRAALRRCLDPGVMKVRK
jgi:RNA polymerase sigma factor (sigma-70 family)